MNKKTTTWVWCSAVPLWWLIYLARKNPETVEVYYSRLFYPMVIQLHQSIMDRIPFSLGDMLYIGLVLLLLRTLIKKISFWKVQPIHLLIDLGSFVIITLWIFHLSWGFNYQRLALNDQLKISIKYSKQDIENCIDQIIEKSNHWHNKIVLSDTLAVRFPFTKNEVADQVELYHPLGQQTIKKTSKVKNSLLSLPLSYMGYAGYLNPFTLESQVNDKMPIMSLITTSLHEMSHQWGYASEKEANFIAYLSAIHSDNPHIKYAGYTFAFRYFFSELHNLDPDRAMEKLKRLNSGILKNYREVNDFWKQYDNPFEILLDKTYDGYLKANGQKSGIKSYNEMVGLVINYHKNEKPF